MVNAPIAASRSVGPDRNRLALEQVLLRHPAVKAAAVFANDVAFVIPDEDWLRSQPGRSTDGATLARWQKTYDLNQSSRAAHSASPGFNIVGWDSTYTRQPLPADHMQEWIGVTVDSILELRPTALYEIGCGSGLLLTRVAPHCERYVGIDFSHEVIARVQEQLQATPALADHVALMQRRADNFEGLDAGSFDTIVINSVVQYFPGLDYLTQVLENAVRLVRPGGRVFIGDVRSLPLLPAFAASVELFQAEDGIDLAELRARTRRRLRITPELVLSPAYFLALPRQLPSISGVEIRPRLGRTDNEMTRYRYNAILHIGRASEPALDVPFETWPADRKPSRIASLLRDRHEPFGIAGIPNARIEKDVVALDLLNRPEAPPTVAALRHALEQLPARGIHPQDLSDLAASAGNRVFLSWAACHRDGSYDALFVPDAVAVPHPPVLRWPQPEPSSFVRVSNHPGQTRLRADLVQRLLTHCQGNPQASFPRRIVLVDALPATAETATGFDETPEFQFE